MVHLTKQVGNQGKGFRFLLRRLFAFASNGNDVKNNDFKGDKIDFSAGKVLLIELRRKHSDQC